MNRHELNERMNEIQIFFHGQLFELVSEMGMKCRSLFADAVEAGIARETEEGAIVTESEILNDFSMAHDQMAKALDTLDRMPNAHEDVKLLRTVTLQK